MCITGSQPCSTVTKSNLVSEGHGNADTSPRRHTIDDDVRVAHARVRPGAMRATMRVVSNPAHSRWPPRCVPFAQTRRARGGGGCDDGGAVGARDRVDGRARRWCGEADDDETGDHGGELEDESKDGERGGDVGGAIGSCGGYGWGERARVRGARVSSCAVYRGCCENCACAMRCDVFCVFCFLRARVGCCARVYV